MPFKSARHGVDRLSDLEAGTLGDIAFEDEAPVPESETLAVSFCREAPTSSLGIQIDLWARQPSAAAEVIVGIIAEDSPAHQGGVVVGDTILSANGVPCCTINEVRAAIDGACEINLTLRRPRHSHLFRAEAALVLWEWGACTTASLTLSSRLELEMCPADGSPPETISLREVGHVALMSARAVEIYGADGDGAPLATVTLGSSAEQQRLHLLLSQGCMCRPETRCDLTGWLQRRGEGSGAPPSPPSTPTSPASPTSPPSGSASAAEYLELYSNGTALAYPSPHRNKLGHARAALAFCDAAVEPDPHEHGAYLVSDRARPGVVWRCWSLQPVSAEDSLADVLARHAIGSGGHERRL